MSLYSTLFFISLNIWQKGLSLYYQNKAPSIKIFFCIRVVVMILVFLVPFFYMQNRKRDTDVQNRLLDSVGEGEGGMVWESSTETCILSMVIQITSPGWMHETRAQAWWTGKTQRDRVEREVGGGIGMETTRISMADSCMTKTTTIL